MKTILILALALVLLLDAKESEKTKNESVPITLTTQTHKAPQWKELRNTLLASMIPGAGIGLLSGYGCTQLEERVLHNNHDLNASRLLTWVGVFFARSGIVSAISKTMTEHEIQHSPAIMQGTAWVVDWMIYLKFAHYYAR